ncbi:hypothetical protein [Hyphococcus luteus]|jgi:ribosomal protein L7/L12|uniref:Ribosomal protein L7/L12 C-terminal domain-containing protein n=1 Tax=Hyphococcus luteus TaxID=2058213 RepID=A0A2S7K7P2_9PROT|nr:hypothetical protein [Marinicaulis flavus]PQA88513.1 hypothetical protein CW354_09510 [Marinicaulis flavus]
MFDFDPTGGWLALAAVAYVAFMIGRMSAAKGETAGEREMRRMQEEQAAEDAFASLSPSVQADVDQLLAEKKIIEAVKVIRENTGKGLKESKDVVDQRRKQFAS